MKLGCPKEIKPQEFRVGMTPAAAQEAIGHGHEVVIETGAGMGAGFTDADYTAVGAKMAITPSIIPPITLTSSQPHSPNIPD